MGSSTVFIKADVLARAIFVLAALCSRVRGETLTGVVLSKHSGQGPDASGMIRLAVRDKVYYLYDGEPLDRHFGSQACEDIGAIWSVVVAFSDGSWDLFGARCKGEVDEAIHAPWLIVVDFMRKMGDQSVMPETMLSARWRSSPDFRVLQERGKRIDISGYRQHSPRGTCIDVVTVDRGSRTQMRAGAECYLELSGKPVDLLFTVVKNPRTRRWEIDEVKLQ